MSPEQTPSTAIETISSKEESQREEEELRSLGAVGMLTELDHRSADGIEVSLLWSRESNKLLVAVEDSRSGESFEVHAPAGKALDVFRHPYAYAA